VPAPTHFNHRSRWWQTRGRGKPGGTNYEQLTPDQHELIKRFVHRMGRDPASVACYILNHTTPEEQAEALRVYRMGVGS
jgi:hypothetical protein